MKVPDPGWPVGTGMAQYDFANYVTTILNDGRYQLRIIDSPPDWTTSDGEMVAVDNGAGKIKQLYMYITDGWYNVSFDPQSGQVVGVPTGTVLPFAGPDTKIPGGFALCNGAAASRTTYATLFALIGTTYGPGDGTSTFNIPDMRVVYPIGAYSAGPVLGSTGGSFTTSATTGAAAYGAGGQNATNGAHTHVATPPYLALNFIVKL